MKGNCTEEFLSIDELCGRIKYRPQTIYNKISIGTFVEGIHFVKPTPKKLLFKWSEIRKWMGVPDDCEQTTVLASEHKNGHIERSSTRKRRNEGVIRI